MELTKPRKKFKKIRIGDGEVGREYFSRNIKATFQLLSKGLENSKVLIHAVDTKHTIPNDYEALERVYDDVIVEKNDDSGVADTVAIETPEESVVEDEEEEGMLNPGSTEEAEQRRTTAKQFIINLLEEGPKTREELARNLFDSKLTKCDSLKKAKTQVSMILHSIKKRNKYTIVSIEPGKYRLEK